MRILLTGGGTGGHIYPLIAVLQELKSQAPTAEISFMGPQSPWNNEFQKYGVKIYKISGSKLRRYLTPMTLLEPFKLILGLFQAFLRLYFLMPDVVFSKGGPGAFPVVIMAWWYRIPVIIHESDSVPGFTNRLCSSFAKKIGIAFQNAASFFPKNKTALVGNPIRKEIAQRERKEGEGVVEKEKLGFNTQKPLMLVLGGSQGALSLNEFITENLKELLELVQIEHQTGEINGAQANLNAQIALHEVSEEKKKEYKMSAHLSAEEMSDALTASDIVFSRAGSGAIFEIASAGKPSFSYV